MAGTSAAHAKGNQLPSAPEWKYTLNGHYQLPLANMPFDLFANFNIEA
jgi:hypothetical protein